ncbi:MAG: 2-hydroxy-3-oxopropionate reductase [Gammaproteobacteria bacterium]|nr:2-hydroxy-3-oxopropionate reductase [Gammaproteobacteria bacterium]
MTEKIGLIGPGIMGQPMGMNLINAGFPLWVFSRTPSRAQPLVDAGATRCDTPAAVAEEADIIISIVSDTPDVEAVVLDDNGVLAGVSAGKVLVDMSTISPIATRSIAGKLAEKGVEMLDAPVSGGEAGAQNGTLSIMVGGKPDVFERVKPVFDVLGKNIVHVGDTGAGQVAKACNQILVAEHINAAGEALLLARACGADPEKVRQALLGGFAYSKVLEVHGERMLTRNFKPGFKAKLHKKDMHIVMNTAEEKGLDLPTARAVTEAIDRAVEDGDGELDSTVLVRILEARNGVDIG